MAIFLNDDYEHFFVRNSPEDMTKEALERQVDLYSQAGVSGCFFCVNAQSAYYDSKVYDTAWKDVVQKEDGLYYHRDVVITDKPLPTLTNTLHAKAACENTANKVFQIRIDRCRVHGMRGGLSIRMNDRHLTDHPESPMHSDFWYNNPQYRLPGGGYDYAEKAVQEEMKGLIREVLEMFDPDAVELDWMRSPPFFRNGHAEENSRCADEMVRFAYEEKCRAEKRCGHRILLYVRVPSRVEEALALGLDVIRWAKNGWIDGVVACAFILCTDSNMPQWIWRSLLPDNVDFMPGMDVLTTPHSESYGIEGDKLALEILTGYAAVFYFRGAKDLYLFNHFFAAAPGMDKELYLHKIESVLTAENAVKNSRRHAATACCNLVPGVIYSSNLPLTAGAGFNQIRIEVGGGLKDRKIRVLFAFTSPETLQESDFEFQVNNVPCTSCEDTDHYALPGKSWHNSTQIMSWQRFICEVPPEAVTEGVMIAAFRATRKLEAQLHWCEFDVEKRV